MTRMIRSCVISLFVCLLMASCIGHLPDPVEPPDRGSPGATGASTFALASADGIVVSPGRSPHVYKISPLAGASVGAGSFQIFQGTADLSGNWSPSSEGDVLGVPLMVQAGERFESVSASVYGNTGMSVDLALFGQDDAFHIGANYYGHSTSGASNTTQTLSLVPPDGQPEDVTSSQRSYWLRFRGHRIHAAEGQLFVGPITVVMSTALAVIN